MPITSRKVFSIYRTLDRDQIRFVIDKVIEGNHTTEEWLNRLNRIAFMDLLGDETREQAGRFSMAFAVLTIIMTFLTILRPVLFFLPIGFLIIFAYFFSLYMSLLKIDISNHMRLFLVPMIEEIREKMNEGANVYLKMDFSSAVTKEKLLETADNEKNKSVKTFRHHWIDGELTLKDGNILEWEIEDRVQQRKSSLADKTERMKFKDYEISHLLKMKITASNDTFRPLDDHLKVENGQIFIPLENESNSTSLEQGMDPAVFMNLLDEAYSKIQPVVQPAT